MPTYRYRCLLCEDEFEIQQGIKEAPLTECTNTVEGVGSHEYFEFHQCGGRLQRLIQPVAVQFRGPGFHVTDYRTRR